MGVVLLAREEVKLLCGGNYPKDEFWGDMDKIQIKKELIPSVLLEVRQTEDQNQLLIPGIEPLEGDPFLRFSNGLEINPLVALLSLGICLSDFVNVWVKRSWSSAGWRHWLTVEVSNVKKTP